MSKIPESRDHQKIQSKAREITEKFAKGDPFAEGEVWGSGTDWFVYLAAREIIPASDTSGVLPRNSTISEISDLRAAVRLLCRGGAQDVAGVLQETIRARILAEIALPLAYAMDEDPNFGRDFQAFKEDEKAQRRAQAQEKEKEAA